MEAQPRQRHGGIPSSIMLDNVISRDGICLNPSKVMVVLDM